MQKSQDSDVFSWILSALVLVIMGTAVGLYSGGPEAGRQKPAGTPEYPGASGSSERMPRADSVSSQQLSARAPRRL